MIIKQLISKLRQYRESIYQSFEYRADAIMDLLDALSSNISANSVVELSLNPLYLRNYSSVEKSIDQFSASRLTDDQKQQRLKLEKVHLASAHHHSTATCTQAEAIPPAGYRCHATTAPLCPNLIRSQSSALS